MSFRVGRRGDSVAAIARRYRLSPEQVAHWNRVGVDARFRAGQKVVVMVAKPLRAPANRAGVTAQKARLGKKR